MMKNKSIKKVLMATTLLLAGVFANPFEASAASTTYSYFEGRLDPGASKLVIKRKDEVSSGLVGEEDKYRTEVINTNSNYGEAYDYSKRRAGNDVYEKLLDPKNKNTDKVYKRRILGEYDISKWGENATQEPSGRNGAVTKILTVPNAPLYTGTDKKHMFTIEPERLAIIEDALVSQDREEKGLSMMNGFNLLLEKIGGLKGGYMDLNDFKKTVQALGWLLGKGDKGDYVIISPNGYTEYNNDQLNDSTGEPSEEEVEKLEEKDVRVVDTNIKVSITHVGTNKKDLVIQVGPDDNIEYKDVFPNIFFQVSTGFTFDYNEYNRTANPSGFMKVSYENVKTGKPVPLYANEGVDGLRKEHVEFIRLYDIVMDALVKAEQDQFESIGVYGNSNSFLEGLLCDALSDFASNLGITPMEELIYNRSDRSTTDKDDKKYKYGLYPEEWDVIVSGIQRPAMAISLAFLGFAILKVVFMLNVDAMNVDSRVNIKRDIMNIITAIGAMVLFNIAFIAIVSLNYVIVGLIYNVLVDGNLEIVETFVGNTSGLIQGTFGDIMLGFVSVGVKAYVNVMYIARSVTIAFLVGMYPIFMVSAAFSGLDKIKDFMAELISNVFLQSFHALVFMFITLASNTYSDVFTNTVLMTLLIPMSGAYRELVLGKKSGTLQGAAMVGTQASQQVKSMFRTGAGMAAGAAGAIAGGGLLFAADRKLNGKDVLKNMRKNLAGSGEGGVGEGLMSKVGDAMAGVDNDKKDSLSLNDIIKDESITTGDIQAKMDSINSAKGMKNMVNIAEAIKKRDIRSVYNLLNENANMNDQHNALAHAKLEKEKYNEQLYNYRARSKAIDDEARSNVPQATTDGNLSYGEEGERSGVSKETLKEYGIQDFKALEGVADTFTARIDVNNDTMGAEVPHTLARAKEQTMAFAKWKSQAVDTSKEAQNKWLKENGGALACAPKEIGEGQYKIQINYMDAEVSRLSEK